LIKTGKPIYWVNSGIHSPETAVRKCCLELAYRLIVEETPFIQSIRNKHDRIHHARWLKWTGREKQVDTLLLRQEDQETTAAFDVLGQVCRAPITIATAWGNI